MALAAEEGESEALPARVGRAEAIALAQTGLSSPLTVLLWKVPRVAPQKRDRIIGDKVDPAANLSLLSRAQPCQAKVGVETAGHSLKELLVWFPGGGEDHLLVLAEGADEAIIRRQRAERTWIDI
jgi:hypothetical protein